MQSTRSQCSSGTLPAGRSPDAREPGSHPLDRDLPPSGPAAWFSKAARLVTSHRPQWDSLKVALVVGTALNALNQGDRVLQGWEMLDWRKALLTYLVPYLVSTYSAACARRRDRP
ncbi:MAG: nitrate/nitrite transporter NrtS [Betaproteobacteria bacterium]|nr:nitrate/nitrite transporter NrtS [Betaproteobacteria bacterium]